MKTRAALLLGMLMLVPFALAQDDAQDDSDPAAAKKKRVIDTTSPVAKALKDLLVMDPRYADDERVEMVYRFTESAHLEDFTHQGFDKMVSGPNRRLGDAGILDVGVGSRSVGLLLHKVPLMDSFEVEWVFRMESSTTSSQVTFVFADGKSGSIWGMALAKRTKRGYKPVSKGDWVDVNRFTNIREIKVKCVVEGRLATCFLDGKKVSETKKLNGKLDGRVGLFARNVRIFVKQFTVKGVVDPSKL